MPVRRSLGAGGEEKIGRAQIKKSEENFFAGWRGFRATAGLASLLGVLLKKCSNINQKTPPLLPTLTLSVSVLNLTVVASFIHCVI